MLVKDNISTTETFDEYLFFYLFDEFFKVFASKLVHTVDVNVTDHVIN